MKINLLLLLALVSFLNSEVVMIRNEINVEAGYEFKENMYWDEAYSANKASLPYLSYKMEMLSQDFFKLYIDGGIGYSIYKNYIDGKIPDDLEDKFDNEITVNLSPAMRFVVPNDYFYEFKIPAYMSIVESQSYKLYVEDKKMNEFKGDIEFGIGHDSSYPYVRMLSPYERFLSGSISRIFLRTDLFYESDIKPKAGPDYVLGFRAVKSLISYKKNAYFAPEVNFITQLNTELENYWWMSLMAHFAHDISKNFNINGNFGIRYGNFDVENDQDDWGNETFIFAKGGINIYPIEVLSIFANVEFDRLLFGDEENQPVDPKLNYELGLRFNFKGYQK